MSENTKRLRGAITALITPHRDDGTVDFDALDRLARWQVDSGIDGIAPCGTTGEGATLDESEHRDVIETVVRAASGKVPVVAGCGSNDTRKTVSAARRSAEAGADALLVVSPYYNKPNRTGILGHYRAVAEATDLPVVVYNVPGRTGQNLGARLILELTEIPGIAAVKEASADLDQMATILRDRPSGFAVLSGDDPLAVPAVALGADGVISVVANEAPAETTKMIRAALEGDLPQARLLHYRLLALMRANFLETNPVPVKTALHLLGRCGPALRPPLGPPEPATIERLRQVLHEAGIAT